MSILGPVVVPPSGSVTGDGNILAIIKAASRALGVKVPTAVYSATGRTEVELAQVANEMARRIRDAHDWSMLKVLNTETGDGTTTTFTLPSDYRKMPKDQQIWSSRTQEPLTHISGGDDWLNLTVRNYSVVTGVWTILGGAVQVMPAPSASESLYYYYISSNMVETAAAEYQASFTADSDIFRLDDRVLELGIIYEWRSRKGLDYKDELADYQEALGKAISDDKGARILTQRSRQRIDASIAYPWTISA